jgi:hypothetical protein
MNTRLSEGKVFRTAKKILGLAGLFAIALVCAGPTRAQSKPPQTDAAASSSAPANPAQVAQAAAPKPAAEPAATAGQSAPKGQSEGLNVHGHWTIVVKNPDGKVVSHTEFENSIVSGGKAILSDILGQQQTAGPWVIEILAPPSACSVTAIPFTSTTQVCAIVQGQPLPTTCGNNCVAGMPAPTVTNAPSVVIAGSITFPTGGPAATITSVATGMFVCPNNVPASVCAAGNVLVLVGSPFSGASNVFTAANLPTGVLVSPGQIVQVTVTLTFS